VGVYQNVFLNEPVNVNGRYVYPVMGLDKATGILEIVKDDKGKPVRFIPNVTHHQQTTKQHHVLNRRANMAKRGPVSVYSAPFNMLGK
jgi:hypothetical protein